MASKRKPRTSVPVPPEGTPAEELQKSSVTQEQGTADTPAGETLESTPTPKSQEEGSPAGITLPCVATVTAALAVLHRSIGLGTDQQLKPVATLKQGAKVTVRVIEGDNAQLANGLWTKIAYLSLGE